jgi:malate dehydrogenase (oxaloacetate-decarboxylating)(NADP+)
MICTGRSDFPNQVNNVLCFPYIFRGALDCGATAINEEMKLAAVRAIAGLAPRGGPVRSGRQEPIRANRRPSAPTIIIPSPFDPRLILRIAPAVAKAAMETAASRSRPIEDFDAYLDRAERASCSAPASS